MAGRSIIAAILAVTLLLFLSCSVYAQQEEPTTPAEEEPVSPESEEQASISNSIFLYMDGGLVPVQREITGGSQMVEFAVLELLKGPSEDELAAGYVTFIPEGVKLQYTTVKQDRSEFSVNLSRELLELSGNRDDSLKALAQIVKTIQDISGIQVVGITVAGESMGDPPQDAYEALGVSAEEVTGEIQGVEPTTEESGNTGLVLAIVLGSAGAVILALLVFFLLKKRKTAEEKAQEKKAPASKKDRKKSEK